VDQVYIHLDFQPAAVCNAIGKRYFCQVAKIHAVLLIFVKTEILDQALCFFRLQNVPRRKIHAFHRFIHCLDDYGAGIVGI